MNIKKLPINLVELNFHRENGINVLNQFSYKGLNIKPNSYGINLENKDGFLLGYEHFMLQSDSFIALKSLFGARIEVEPEERGKNLGEFLRLLSVVTAKKNHCQNITIYSLPEALGFHTKYGFHSAIDSSRDARKVLEAIKNDKSFDFTKSIEAAYKNESDKDTFINNVNLLTNEYLNSVYSAKKSSQFKNTIKMKLDIGNKMTKTLKDFYNDKFKANGIDYKI